MGLRSWYLWKGGRPFAALLDRLVWLRATAGVLVLHDDQLLAIDTGDYLMLPVGEPVRETPLAEPSWEGRPTWVSLSEARTRRWRFDRPVGSGGRTRWRQTPHRPSRFHPRPVGLSP